MLLIKKLRMVSVCAMLQLSVFAGAPVRPEQIEELMHQMNEPKLAQVLPDESDDGDGNAPESTHPAVFRQDRASDLFS